MEPENGCQLNDDIYDCVWTIRYITGIKCLACQNGKRPGVYNDQCFGYISNCEIGYKSVNSNQASCFKCKEGYISDDGNCVIRKSGQEGCLTSSGGECTWCDAENGYFATEQNLGWCQKIGAGDAPNKRAKVLKQFHPLIGLQ